MSFDGTWMTRGHKSHIGIRFIIDINTGTVVDFEVLSNFCYICKMEERKGKKKDHSCVKDFDGKSGSMEAEASA